MVNSDQKCMMLKPIIKDTHGLYNTRQVRFSIPRKSGVRINTRTRNDENSIVPRLIFTLHKYYTSYTKWKEDTHK